MNCRKRIRLSEKSSTDPFERLPDDLVISILTKLSSTVSSPSDFINALTVCKRFNRLGLNQLVLSKAGPKLFSIKAKNWSESAHRFLKQCVSSGNIEASYFLGMIRFYCLKNRCSGASLMAKAAIRSHPQALYSLAIIQFNGSGGTKNDKDLRAGVALCGRAAYLGHIDALRELGHCLQDGYGVRRNIVEGRRLLVQANARELASVFTSVHQPATKNSGKSRCRRRHGNESQREMVNQKQEVCDERGLVMDEEIQGTGSSCALLSDFGCNVPAPEPHPANKFMIEWFELNGGSLDGGDVRMCSHSGCGRPETRPHEFRRCSVCGGANYCSRGCQAHDWKLRHKTQCIIDQWLNEVAINGVDDAGGDDQGAEDMEVRS